MKTITRRNLLASFGMIGGSAVLTGGCNHSAANMVDSAKETGSSESGLGTTARDWNYIRLDPTIVAESESAGLKAEVQSCIDCHGKQDRADAMVKMQCDTCHQFDAEHP